MAASGVEFSPGRAEIMLGAVAATATTSSASSNLTVGVTTNRLWYNYQKKIEPEPSFPAQQMFGLLLELINHRC
jgi:hypothetical protein